MLDRVKKKKFTPYPKGRDVSQTSIDEVHDLIKHLPNKRDMLIEYLHLIQDKYRCIKKNHLAALSDIMKIPFAEAFEVASFYAHFDVLEDDERSPPEITIRVCDSLTCELKGSDKLIKDLKKKYKDNVRILRAPCMGLCDFAPACEVGHNHLKNCSLKTISKAVKEKSTHPDIVEGITLNRYIENGGYSILKNCYLGKLDVNNIIEELEKSGLKGMGGAGFPSGQKWKFVRMETGPRIMTINGDEGEPGTFKDKLYLENDVHRFFEGMLIAAWAVEAKKIYIYMRDEYPGIRLKMIRELDSLKKMKIIDDKTEVYIRRGAGAYICGEESAMIESIEGKRGLPRHKPPFVSKVGLFGMPTLNHNIETVFWVRDILENGSKWFSSQGRAGRKGPHSYSVSGRVKNPGVKLAPAGITMNELINEYCGGMEDGHKFYGYLPGGASGGILPSNMADIPLDFGTLEEYGCFIGSGAIVVFSDKDDITKVVLNLLKFFEDESCGQCTPCRVGTEKAVKLLEKRNWDKNLLDELVEMMSDASICGLGQAAGNPIKCAIKYFSKDL